LWAALLVLVCAAVVAAQPGPPPDAPRWGREQVETVIIGKFATELNLTPEQAESFFPRLRQFQNQTEEMQRGQGERRRLLSGFSDDANADSQKVNDLLKEQNRHEQQMLESKRLFLEDVSHFLTPQQVSRCSILMDELPRRLHKFIEERRREGGMEPQQHRESYPPGRGRRRGY
jgi:Spy/CpxP family protein refolding chaperone